MAPASFSGGPLHAVGSWLAVLRSSQPLGWLGIDRWSTYDSGRCWLLARQPPAAGAGRVARVRFIVGGPAAVPGARGCVRSPCWAWRWVRPGWPMTLRRATMKFLTRDDGTRAEIALVEGPEVRSRADSW